MLSPNVGPERGGVYRLDSINYTYHKKLWLNRSRNEMAELLKIQRMCGWWWWIQSNYFVTFDRFISFSRSRSEAVTTKQNKTQSKGQLMHMKYALVFIVLLLPAIAHIKSFLKIAELYQIQIRSANKVHCVYLCMCHVSDFR